MSDRPSALNHIERLTHACRKENIEPPLGIVVSPEEMTQVKHWVDAQPWLKRIDPEGVQFVYRGVELRQK